MYQKLTEAVTRFLKGPRGVNFYLSQVVVEDGMPQPVMPLKITNAFTDSFIQSDQNEPEPLFPQVIVNSFDPVEFRGDGPANRLTSQRARVYVGVIYQDTDRVRANWRLSYILEAVHRSLQCLVYSRDGFDARDWGTFAGLQIEGMPSCVYGPIGAGAIENSTEGLIIATFEVAQVDD